jgi:hypothetical protein
MPDRLARLLNDPDVIVKWAAVGAAAWAALKYILSPLKALKRLEEAVARIERTLHGEDGRPGLVAKVDELNTDRNEEQKRELADVREQLEEYRRREREHSR